MSRQPALAYLPETGFPDKHFLDRVARFVSGYQYKSARCCGFFPSFKKSPDDCLVRDLKEELNANNTAEYKYVCIHSLLISHSEEISDQLKTELQSKGILNQSGQPMQVFLDKMYKHVKDTSGEIIEEYSDDPLESYPQGYGNLELPW